MSPFASASGSHRFNKGQFAAAGQEYHNEPDSGAGFRKMVSKEGQSGTKRNEMETRASRVQLAEVDGAFDGDWEEGGRIMSGHSRRRSLNRSLTSAWEQMLSDEAVSMPFHLSLFLLDMHRHQ
jgi:hypothetical protein